MGKKILNLEARGLRRRVSKYTAAALLISGRCRGLERDRGFFNCFGEGKEHWSGEFSVNKNLVFVLKALLIIFFKWHKLLY